MKHKIQMIPLEDIVNDENTNVRWHDQYDEAGLAIDILAHGLETPLTVRRLPDDTYDVIQGARRFRALNLIANRNAEKYNTLFGKGIPCKVLEGISDEDARVLKVDHGNTKSLSEGETMIAFRTLYHRLGGSESATANRLRALFDACWGAPPREPEKHGADDASATAAQLSAWNERWYTKHRGTIQHAARAARLPVEIHRAIAAYMDKRADAPLYLTQEDVKTLDKLRAQDVQDGKLPDKDGFTPSVRTQWNAMMAESTTSRHPLDAKIRNAHKPRGVSAKAAAAEGSVQKLDIQLAMVECKSAIVNKVLAAIVKNDMDGLMAADKEAAEIETALAKA